MISYENFDLRIRSDGDRYVVSGRRGSQVATEPLDLDLTVRWDLWHLECAGKTVVRDRGADLFDALIHGRIRDLYQQGRGHAHADAAAGMRIRLLFDPRDERLRPLIAIPWELLRERTADANDLPALDARRPVVRMIDSVEQPAASDDGPLRRVLLALANPPQSTELQLDRERAAVEKILAGISVRVDVLPAATRATLLDAVVDASPQIVHFMGHSDLDSATGEGILLLEDPRSGEERLPAQVFAGFFTGRPAPRLVILTSCLSASAGSSQPFAGIAYALVAAGLPAVLAMQSEIRDANAIRFTNCLYQRLADGDPIEAAVAHARRALSINRLQTLDWASPVLFLREQAKSDAQRQREQPAAQAPVGSPYLSIVKNEGPVENQVNAGTIGTLNLSGRGRTRER